MSLYYICGFASLARREILLSSSALTVTFLLSTRAGSPITAFPLEGTGWTLFSFSFWGGDKAEARATGMRQRPLVWRNCMAFVTLDSMSFTSSRSNAASSDWKTMSAIWPDNGEANKPLSSYWLKWKQKFLLINKMKRPWHQKVKYI